MQAMGKNTPLIDQVLDIEWEMFTTVQSRGGRASCQDDRSGFDLIRRSQFITWSEETLKSYLNCLQEAKAAGKNLMTLKYARMENLIPPPNPEVLPLIDRIAEIALEWQVEFSQKFPYIEQARPVYRWQEGMSGVTSSETYLRGELETYSLKTLESYFRDVLEKKSKGLNGVELVYENNVKGLGYESLQEANDIAKARYEKQLEEIKKQRGSGGA